MLKCSHFQAETEHGPSAIPLFGKADAFFEKTASAQLLPEVSRYIASLRPQPGSQYVLVNAMGAGEYYGCFPAGTLVETSAGEVPIEQVEPGQLVRTHENRFRPVVARVPKQAAELCDLYVRGLPALVPALTATPNHELWVVTREEMLRAKKKVWHLYAGPLEDRLKEAVSELDFNWSPIAELQPGDFIAEPFPLEEDSKALGDECWNTPEVAFLMGLYAAEGCIAYRYDRADEEPASVIYVISGAELGVVDRARECARVLNHGLQDYPSASGTSIRLQLCFKKLAALCLQHVGSPATDKVLSGDILRMPREWQRIFFESYAAGDGCVRRSGKDVGGIRCVSASARLLRGIRLLVARLGYVASIGGRHNTKSSWYNGNPIYELSISGGQLRKRDDGSHGGPKSYLHPAGFILSAVKKTETYAWDGEVYDLTVEEDSSFIASGITVHNSNINGDYFSEASLIHKPDDWQNNPVFDRELAKSWAYGFPTFYRAHPYAHHRNKDASRAFGEVELAAWNPEMKRVELVTRVDKDKCLAFGGQGTWDKLKSGSYPDVSMGTKVPFDTCSICLDWERYKKACDSFDPVRHKHPGMAALEYHKNQGAIRGLSITRSDYCEHALKQMNKIFPDGKKSFVLNDWPSFFDISFVFIGADKTAKTMLFIFSSSVPHSAVRSSAEIADSLGIQDLGGESKTASIDDEILKQAFGHKVARLKGAEIDKQVVPSQFAGKAVPILTQCEEDLPDETLDRMSSLPPENVLSTLGGMGVLLRPREFQRLTLIQLGKRDLADELDQNGEVFERSGEREDMGVKAENFLPALAELLAPLIAQRSLLAPEIERRVVMSSTAGEAKMARAPSHSKDLLDKIAAAYNGYRHDVMELAAHSQHLLASAGTRSPLQKLASVSMGEVFSPLSVAYLRYAYDDEFGTHAHEQTSGRRGEGSPLKEHVEHR